MERFLIFADHLVYVVRNPDGETGAPNAAKKNRKDIRFTYALQGKRNGTGGRETFKVSIRVLGISCLPWHSRHYLQR